MRRLLVYSMVAIGLAASGCASVVGRTDESEIEVHAMLLNENCDVLQPILDGLEVPEDGLAVFWTGQAGFAIKTHSGSLVLIDPHLSFSMRRATYFYEQPVLDPTVVKPNLVFCTHDHIDHTDPETLVPLAEHSPETVFVGPPESAAHMKRLGIADDRIVEMRIGDSKQWGEIDVRTVYADCTDKRFTTHLGYIITVGSITLYHTGDTSRFIERYREKLERIRGLRPDIMLVPVNKGYNNPGIETAIELTRMAEPRIVVPMHIECVHENTVDPQPFLDAVQKMSGTESIRLKNGQGVLLRRD